MRKQKITVFKVHSTVRNGKISEKIPRRENTIIVHKKCHTLCSSLLSSTENLNAKEQKKKKRILNHLVTLKTTEKRMKITRGEG